jgi:hypothetical protein
MSQEYQVQINLTCNNPSNGTGFVWTQRETLQLNQNSQGINEQIVSVPTTATTYSFSNLSTYGLCYIQNLDATNYVQYGVEYVTISAPTLSSPTGSTTGGTLAANTYYYVVTAVTPGGETVASGEQSVTTTGSTSSVSLSWSSVTGASGYKVYRGTASNAENVYYTVSGGATTTYDDTGATPTSGSPPGSNTTNFVPLGKIEAGEVHLLRLTPGITFAMKANGNAVNTHIAVFED